MAGAEMLVTGDEDWISAVHKCGRCERSCEEVYRVRDGWWAPAPQTRWCVECDSLMTVTTEYLTAEEMAARARGHMTDMLGMVKFPIEG